MSYKKDKDDFIYSLKYDEQTIYYFDDSLFQGQEPSNIVDSDTVCKISEISDHIEEFAKFFDIGYFACEGLLKIEYVRESHSIENLPVVCNSKNESVKFSTKFIKNQTISGEDFFDCKISIIIDLTKSFGEILSDIDILDDLNDFFSTAGLFELIGVSSDNNFQEYISAERMFMLEKEEYAFIMMEYCQLRKYMKLSKESAQACLKKIYNFEKES